ncbi:MAG TPA: L-seryl-tRNA(Sec) selenium transferase [Solirubrobacteraceae bacterium]|jgi:L-seryl-tRNA(Ser) seleniumtransferase|nr:L-seryl-tRNA(Sec) selenium transferase [Solirubrobacteraceae bacterium]
MTEETTNRLRALPSVDRLATAVARVELAERRREILAEASGRNVGEADLLAGARARLRPSLRRVLNATGVIVHTNLGRAPLAPAAIAAVVEAARGYSNLELDLARGERSRRGRRVESLLAELTGAEDALVVNNGAAAVLLAVSALAGPGREAIVSRGELIEIGGGFRIPDVVAQSGATLVEVGATNRTRAGDYAAAIGEHTGAILRVHQSNFTMSGFVERPALGELVALGPPVIDDLGSGVLAEEHPMLAGEPTARESLAGGATLACFSGDKLLGGPQAGLIVGAAAAVHACRAHPLARALRVDKLCLAGLEATLLLHRDPDLARREIPVLAMLDADPMQLAQRTERLARATGGEIVEAVARVGGGALPLCELSGPAVALDSHAPQQSVRESARASSDRSVLKSARPSPDLSVRESARRSSNQSVLKSPDPRASPQALAARLRAGDPPLLARIHEGCVLLDARTLSDAEIAVAAECVARAR